MNGDLERQDISCYIAKNIYYTCEKERSLHLVTEL